jgi:hypothetical protein
MRMFHTSDIPLDVLAPLFPGFEPVMSPLPCSAIQAVVVHSLYVCVCIIAISNRIIFILEEKKHLLLLLCVAWKLRVWCSGVHYSALLTVWSTSITIAFAGTFWPGPESHEWWAVVFLLQVVMQTLQSLSHYVQVAQLDPGQLMLSNTSTGIDDLCHFRQLPITSGISTMLPTVKSKSILLLRWYQSKCTHRSIDCIL